MSVQVDVLIQGFPGQTSICKLAWATVLLVRTDGHNIVIDTGSYAAKKLVLPALRAKGLEPEDIDTLLLTHLHHDHVAGIDMFPQALFVYSETEWSFANTTDDLALQVANLSLLHAYRRRLVKNDGEEIFPGISAIFTPGHTPGGLSYALDIDGKKWIATGDAVKNRAELNRGEAEGPAETLEACRASIAKVKRMADYVLPGHDCPLKVEGESVTPLGENAVTFILPKGITVNGQERLLLKVD